MVRQCEYCGVEFETTRARKKYCSKKCVYEMHKKQAREYYQRVKGNRRYEKVCLFCGKEFVTTRVNKKYCDKKCRYAEQYRRLWRKKHLWYRSNREAISYQKKYHRFFGRWLRIEVARKYCRKGNAQ